MVATNDDLLKALNELNETIKYAFGLKQTQEEIKTELTSRVSEKLKYIG